MLSGDTTPGGAAQRGNTEAPQEFVVSPYLASNLLLGRGHNKGVSPAACSQEGPSTALRENRTGKHAREYNPSASPQPLRSRIEGASFS